MIANRDRDLLCVFELFMLHPHIGQPEQCAHLDDHTSFLALFSLFGTAPKK